MASPDIASSQITKAERWNKLYRVIHHLFLRNEFIHKDDYLQMVKDMNARFTALENMLVSELSKVQATVQAHSHIVKTTGGPTAQAGIAEPNPAPVYTSAAKPGVAVVPIYTNMYNEDLRLLGLGPAKAPLAGGLSSDELFANTTSVADVGA